MFDDNEKVITHAVSITFLFIWFALIWFFPYQAAFFSIFVGAYTIGIMCYSFGKFIVERFLQ